MISNVQSQIDPDVKQRTGELVHIIHGYDLATGELTTATVCRVVDGTLRIIADFPAPVDIADLRKFLERDKEKPNA